MRALIAGCGYVGSALAERLANEGHEVFAVRRREAHMPTGVHLVRADLSRAETLGALPVRIDTVFYTAAPDDSSERAYRAAYGDGLRSLLAALAESRPKRILLTTSTGVYAQESGEWVDETSATVPTRFQGRALLEAEVLVHASGITAIAVRFGGIYGPGRTRLIDEVRSGAAAVPDRPSYTNRIHRDDCAGVLMHLAGLPKPAAVYLGVDHEPADRREVVRWLAKRLDAPEPRIEAVGGAPEHGKRCRNTALRATGYRFRYPSFREGYLSVLAELDSTSGSSR